MRTARKMRKRSLFRRHRDLLALDERSLYGHRLQLRNASSRFCGVIGPAPHGPPLLSNTRPRGELSPILRWIGPGSEAKAEGRLMRRWAVDLNYPALAARRRRAAAGVSPRGATGNRSPGRAYGPF